MKTHIHNILAHGKYMGMNAQLLVESLQTQVKPVPFLPHPAILKSLYSWDFGLRGLSIMHFRRINVDEKREASRQYGMTDFSKCSAMPRPKPPQSLADVIAAFDELLSLSIKLFLPLVESLLRGARRFAVELQLICVRFDNAMLYEFCA